MKMFLVVWGLTGLFAWGKIVGYLDWSWWLVFVAPLSALAISLSCLIALGIVWIVENKK
jgi:hypothetical protein